MKIIFDDQTGYRQASKILQRNRIQFEPTRSYADMWAFCLNSRTIHLYSSVTDHQFETQNDADEEIIPSVLIPIQYLFDQNNLFWLLLEQRPTFLETKFNPDIESISDQSIPVMINNEKQTIKVCHEVQMQLLYGALTSMNVFHYHPKFSHRKRTKWTVSSEESSNRKRRAKRIDSVEGDNENQVLTILSSIGVFSSFIDLFG